MDTGDKLRKRRTDLGLTQAGVAAKVAMSVVQYNGYENGRHEPSEKTMARIAKALKSAAEDLYGDAEVLEENSVEALIKALTVRLADNNDVSEEKVKVFFQIG
jgi:transcriptional regulator with XRE-family HTH domain